MKKTLLISLILLFACSPVFAQKKGFKAMFLAKKKDDMTVAQFKQYELETHAPLVTSIPGLKAYEVNLAVPTEDGQAYDAVSPYDIIVCLWFDSMEDFQKGMTSEEAQVAIADQPNFLKEKAVMMIVEEHNPVIE